MTCRLSSCVATLVPAMMCLLMLTNRADASLLQCPSSGCPAGTEQFTELQMQSLLSFMESDLVTRGIHGKVRSMIAKLPRAVMFKSNSQSNYCIDGKSFSRVINQALLATQATKSNTNVLNRKQDLVSEAENSTEPLVFSKQANKAIVPDVLFIPLDPRTFTCKVALTASDARTYCQSIAISWCDHLRRTVQPDAYSRIYPVASSVSNLDNVKSMQRCYAMSLDPTGSNDCLLVDEAYFPDSNGDYIYHAVHSGWSCINN